jgi:hypothetical protein
VRISYVALFFALILGAADMASAQRAASPRGEASTQIGSTDGPWMVVDYGRPILRGRTAIFGSGEEYGQGLYAGAPVWRAGANVTTTLTTETDLGIAGKHLPAGTYTLFVELTSPTEWTLIISGHKAKPSYRSEEEGLWGAYGYTADKDVIRAPMAVNPLEVMVDQFTISFMNVTEAGGQMAMIWGNTMGAVNFEVH